MDKSYNVLKKFGDNLHLRKVHKPLRSRKIFKKNPTKRFADEHHRRELHFVLSRLVSRLNELCRGKRIVEAYVVEGYGFGLVNSRIHSLLCRQL